MPTDFDPGYGAEPFATLVREHPGVSAYPAADFRVEWGPMFHRGRLDGSARVLVLGQDPAQHETIARRILVGEAGQRVQGLLAKLGLDRSYVMINAFLYSVYGQGGGNRHKDDAAIAAYRARWLLALLPGSVEAVVACGTLADHTWRGFLATPAGSAFAALPYAGLIHPTWPEASGKTEEARATKRAKMLADWNVGLAAIHPKVKTPDTPRAFVPYGTAFAPGEVREIPACDLPAGSPAWMRAIEPWAARGVDKNRAYAKRTTIVVTARLSS